MNRPVLAAVAGLAVLGMTAAAAYVIASPGGEEEAVQRVETATPSPASSETPASSGTPSVPALSTISPTVPGELPPPAEGYTWYLSPPSNFGLPSYAVQVPLEWPPLNPGDSNPQDFAAPGVENVLMGPSLTTVTTIADAASAPAFLFQLPSQGGQLCGVLGDGQLHSISYTWDLFTFKCPGDKSSVCEVDHALNSIVCKSLDGSPAASTIDGRAAEIRIGGFFHSVLVFDPESSSGTAGVFDQAVKSFTLR